MNKAKLISSCISDRVRCGVWGNRSTHRKLRHSPHLWVSIQVWYNTVTFPHYTIPYNPYCVVSHATQDPMICHAKPICGFLAPISSSLPRVVRWSQGYQRFRHQPIITQLKQQPCFLSPISSNKEEESIENDQGPPCKGRGQWLCANKASLVSRWPLPKILFVWTLLILDPRLAGPSLQPPLLVLSF